MKTNYFLLLIIKELLGLRCLRVLPPLAGLPQGEQGWRPPPDLPSPPPIGWETGFWAVPRTVGFIPIQRLRPALPSQTVAYSGLLTCPSVARHSTCTFRISPLGNCSWA